MRANSPFPSTQLECRHLFVELNRYFVPLIRGCCIILLFLQYSAYKGFLHLGAGLAAGMASMAAGMPQSRSEVECAAPPCFLTLPAWRAIVDGVE